MSCVLTFSLDQAALQAGKVHVELLFDEYRFVGTRTLTCVLPMSFGAGEIAVIAATCSVGGLLAISVGAIVWFRKSLTADLDRRRIHRIKRR